MKWTVLWKPDAEDDLTNLWVAASDKSAITAAANRIDAQLKKDPVHTGQPHGAHERVHFDPPLGIAFAVDEGDCKVLVGRVWRVPTASKNGKQVHA